MFGWEGNGHDPLVRRIVPGDARVTEIAQMQIQHRIALVSRPGAPIIEAIGEVLCLEWVTRGVSISGVDGYETGPACAAEAAAVLSVHHHTTGENHLFPFLRNGDR